MMYLCIVNDTREWKAWLHPPLIENLEPLLPPMLNVVPLLPMLPHPVIVRDLKRLDEELVGLGGVYVLGEFVEITGELISFKLRDQVVPEASQLQPVHVHSELSP